MSARTGTLSHASGLDPARKRFLTVNVVGGIAVLGSYVLGLAGSAALRSGLWGGVPESLQPVYTVNMFLAAAGYFLFTFYVMFRLDPDRVRILGGRFGFGAFTALYAVILATSAVWLPLTAMMLESPGPGLWIAIRTGLALTGLASIGLWVAIAGAEPRGGRTSRWLALVGIAPFTLQTAVLDALVWPAYYPA